MANAPSADASPVSTATADSTCSAASQSQQQQQQQQQHRQSRSKQHRSRSFSGLAASSLFDMLAHRPRLFSKKSSTPRPGPDGVGGAPLGDSAKPPRLVVPTQIVVSEVCVDPDGEEFEVTWTAFDSSWPSGGRGSGGGGAGGGSDHQRHRASSNSPKSAPRKIQARLRSRSDPEEAPEGGDASEAAGTSTASSAAGSLGVNRHQHRRESQTHEAFLRSSCAGRRNAVCVELDRRQFDSALARFSEHAAIVDAMKQCF